MNYPSAIMIDPEIQGGVPCFAGTRVPVKSLFDAIKHGRSIDYFLEQFPSVKRTQVEAVLDDGHERHRSRLLAKPEVPSFVGHDPLGAYQ